MEHNARIVQRDTGAWRLQVWISFGIALLICGTGLAWLPGGDLDRAFMVMGYFFCLSSAFVLAKYVRDNAAAPSDTPMWSLVVWGGFGAGDGAHRLGPVAHGDQPDLEGLPDGELALPDLVRLHPGQDPARRLRGRSTGA
jgi:hypothetical protein